MKCTDDDECAQEGACDPSADCRNTVGGFECFCPSGKVMVEKIFKPLCVGLLRFRNTLP